MGGLLKLALTALAASSQTSALKVFTRRLIAALVLGGLGLLLVLAAWGCLCAAIWIWLTPSLGPVGAPLVVAAICLVVGGVLGLVAWELTRRQRPRPASDLNVDALLSDAGRLINEHKGAALLAAALLGLFAGNGRRR
jgi:hypothetical protein